MKSICIFCGSSLGFDEVYVNTSSTFAQFLAKNGYSVVFGGGSVGLMGVIANKFLEHSKDIIGVIPKSLDEKEVGHKGVDLRVVDTMHERKKIMYDLSDAFIILPGGFGTLDEFHEILTWGQLGYHQKPIGVLNINNYYDHLLKHFRLAVAEGFVTDAHLNMITVEKDYEMLLNKLKEYRHKDATQWLTKEVKP